MFTENSTQTCLRAFFLNFVYALTIQRNNHSLLVRTCLRFISSFLLLTQKLQPQQDFIPRIPLNHARSLLAELARRLNLGPRYHANARLAKRNYQTRTKRRAEARWDITHDIVKLRYQLSSQMPRTKLARTSNDGGMKRPQI